MPTKDTSVSWPVYLHGRGYDEAVGPPAWLSTSKVRTMVRQRTGVRLPHYKEIIASNGNATTNMTASYYTCDEWRDGIKLYRSRFRSTLNPTQVFVRENEGDICYMAHAQLDPLAPSKDITFVRNLALSAFYKKLHQVERQFQGYVFLGELGETLHLLRHPTQTLHNLCKDFLDTLRKRKRADPKRWLNGLGSAWLEQSFGWNPLMADIKDAIKAYDRFTEPSQTASISAGARKTYPLADDINYKVGDTFRINGGLYWMAKAANRSETHIIRFKGKLYAQVECPRWGDYSLFGFNPQEFIPAAWELLPWSFLIDYFANIGDILDASITSTRNLAFMNESQVRYTTAYRVLEVDNLSTALALGTTWYTDTTTGGRVAMLVKRKEVSRIRNVGYSMPTLQFNFSLSDGQLGNCAALLSQALSLHPQDKPRKWHR